jgi:hypothetical protein
MVYSTRAFWHHYMSGVSGTVQVAAVPCSPLLSRTLLFGSSFAACLAAGRRRRCLRMGEQRRPQWSEESSSEKSPPVPVSGSCLPTGTRQLLLVG